MTLRTTAAGLAALLFAAAPAFAGGAIDATQYVPLGAFNAWEMIDKEIWDTTSIKDEHQIISVTKTDVVQGVPRYNVRTKLFQDVPDVLFQLGIEGDTLFLYGVRILLPTEFINDNDVDVNIPTIFFDQKVPIGSTSTPLDVPIVTQVTAKFNVSISLGPLDDSGNVFIDPGSTVTARWESVPGPIDTPLGDFSSTPLARLVLDFHFTYSSDNGDIDDEVNDEVTDKSVSAIMGPDVGFVLIDGQGSQEKIVNRVVLPGELVSDPADLDAFPPLPPNDVNTIAVPLSTGVVIITFGAGAEGSISDGTMTLSDITLDHGLNGVVRIDATAEAGGDSAAIALTGKAKYSAATNSVKVALKGKTKKLEGFAKSVNFSVKDEVSLGAEGSATLDVVYTAGKDPLTGELITGSLPVPISLFQPTTANLVVNTPVDVPKIKNSQFLINPLKRLLGAQGVLTLAGVGEGEGLVYPVILLESAVVKEGLPTARSYTLIQLGTLAKLFKMKATSTAEAFDLSALSGKLAGVKQKPDLGSVVVTTN